MDEVSIYNRPLTATEVQTLYRAVMPAVVKGVVNWTSPYNVTCQNNTTGASISIANNKSTQYDCEKAGLTVKSGDEVSVTVTGKRF